MIETLCKLVEDNYQHLNITIGYTKITDWCVEVAERVSPGIEKCIVSAQDADLSLACAKAYINTKQWLLDREE